MSYKTKLFILGMAIIVLLFVATSTSTQYDDPFDTPNDVTVKEFEQGVMGLLESFFGSIEESIEEVGKDLGVQPQKKEEIQQSSFLNNKERKSQFYSDKLPAPVIIRDGDKLVMKWSGLRAYIDRSEQSFEEDSFQPFSPQSKHSSKNIKNKIIELAKREMNKHVVLHLSQKHIQSLSQSDVESVVFRSSGGLESTALITNEREKSEGMFLDYYQFLQIDLSLAVSIGPVVSKLDQMIIQKEKVKQKSIQEKEVVLAEKRNKLDILEAEAQKERDLIREKEEALKKLRIEKERKTKRLSEEYTRDRTSPIIDILGLSDDGVLHTDSIVTDIYGVVIDDSQIAEVIVHSQSAAVEKDGTFIKPIFVALGKTEINVRAIDIYGNISTKKVLINRTPVVMLEKRDPDLVPPSEPIQENSNALALIIGIEDYRDIGLAKNAKNDASMFYDYARTVLGIHPDRIKPLLNEDAEYRNILKNLKYWLSAETEPGKSDIYIFFAGHGLATPDGKNAYLLPYDADPLLLDETAISRSRLVSMLQSYKPHTVTMFLDTCYSGKARDGGSTLVADARALRMKVKDTRLPSNFTIFSATTRDQIASSHAEQDHGLFSYFLMRGLGGEADRNRDHYITARELSEYVRPMVEKRAKRAGRDQTPQFLGRDNQVLVSW